MFCPRFPREPLHRSTDNTEPRREIVSGFLEFRGALQTIGLVKGFQWIDGDLSPADDDAAKAQLDAMLNERGQP